MLAAGLSTSVAPQSLHMPDGRLHPDGTLRIGLDTMAPYGALSAEATVLPWLAIGARYTRVDGVIAFGGITGFGDYKDKAFDLKLRLLEEDGYRPAVSFGMQDFHGTRLFSSEYLAASKRVGDFDLSLGVGRGRIDGLFGGVSWDVPTWHGVSLLAEWDAIDYSRDFHAQRTGVVVREGGLTLGARVQRGWWSATLFHQDGEWGGKVFLSVPLQQRDFITKGDDQQPVTLERGLRPSLKDWQDTPDSLQPLVRSLAREGFAGVVVRVEGDRLEVVIANIWTAMTGRAAGRAARVIAFHAPDEAHALSLTLMEAGLPLLTYRFDDLALLRAYFEGEIANETLLPTLSAAYVDAEAFERLRLEGIPWQDIIEPGDGRWTVRTGSLALGSTVSVRRNRSDAGSFTLQPARALFYFNDPAGALKYDLYALGAYSRWLGDGLVFTGVLRFSIMETVSGTIGSSNSALPRVRSDVPRYRREGDRLKLHAITLAHYANPRDRLYTVFSAGIYEEMFAGIGGEMLFLPRTGNWAADVRAYGVRQRDFLGQLGFQDYQTVTAIASLYYRVPGQGLTFTARGGRFLARDHGVRFELKRRFASGFELGGWYTVTDGKDITSPGSPADPYRDKGIFLRLALAPLLSRDTGAVVDFAMSPWARDPGQMVYAPGGLHDRFERRLKLNISDYDQWTDFGH